MMNTIKQENAFEDISVLINNISDMFIAVDMPRLANTDLYIGAPHSLLEKLGGALGRQIEENDSRRFYNRMRYAGIVRERTENTFKWEDNTYPMMAPGLIEQALTLGFIGEKKNIVMAGPPGVGKSVFAVILACKALRKEFSVKYRTAHDIVTDLQEARQGDSLSRYINRMQACDMLVIEDITYSDPDGRSAHDFFSIIDKRYGRKSTVITTNGNLKEWATLFPDKRMFTALLGRLYEDALVMNMNGAKDMRLSRSQDIFDDVERMVAKNEIS
jgi:DNA replication protein DnaC